MRVAKELTLRNPCVAARCVDVDAIRGGDKELLVAAERAVADADRTEHLVDLPTTPAEVYQTCSGGIASCERDAGRRAVCYMCM